jgi:hypothetical protein
VTTPDRRDEPLARTLRDLSSSEPSAETCPDVSTMAAWWEGRLTPEERAACETHVAECARCQETIAAIAAAEDEASPSSDREAASRPAWRHAVWAVPAAAALVLATWLGLRPAGIVEPDRPAAEGVAMALKVEGDEARLPAPEVRQEAVPPVDRAEPPVGRPAPPTASSDPLAARAKSPRTGPVEDRSQRMADEQAAAPPLARGAQRAPSPQTIPATPQAPAAAMAESVTVATPLEVSSPGLERRWRVSLDGAIEGSKDGGRTWTRDFIPPAALYAGVSPADEVCWYAGAAGLVLRLAGEEGWARATAPTRSDLVAIEAADAVTATATTREGLRYTTSDGGRSWTLQVPPPSPFQP